ncbi:MAG TPA: rubredoxin, partial [Gaiellaceae bacterium]|nr:rubredoxin [Gaiellaceae bacterium]
MVPPADRGQGRPRGPHAEQAPGAPPGGAGRDRSHGTKKWICETCGFVYDAEKGDEDGGIPAGTKFEDIPDDWMCPVCGARKKDFREMEPGARARCLGRRRGTPRSERACSSSTGGASARPACSPRRSRREDRRLRQTGPAPRRCALRQP